MHRIAPKRSSANVQGLRVAPVNWTIARERCSSRRLRRREGTAQDVGSQFAGFQHVRPLERRSPEIVKPVRTGDTLGKPRTMKNATKRGYVDGKCQLSRYSGSGTNGLQLSHLRHGHFSPVTVPVFDHGGEQHDKLALLRPEPERIGRTDLIFENSQNSISPHNYELTPPGDASASTSMSATLGNEAWRPQRPSRRRALKRRFAADSSAALQRQ